MNPYAQGALRKRHRSRQPIEALAGCKISVNYLHEEMRQCDLSGLHHAAVLAANALLEATLRAAIEWHKNPVWGKPDVEHVEKLAKKAMGWLLKEAHDLGLLTDEEYQKLDVGRDEIRNAHQHGRVPSTIKEAGPLSGVSADLRTGERNAEALDPKKRPDVASLSLLLYDYHFGPLWVRQIDYVVRKLMAPVIRLAAEMRARGELGGLGVLPSE